MLRVCANETCHLAFIPQNVEQKYCCKYCKRDQNERTRKRRRRAERNLVKER